MSEPNSLYVKIKITKEKLEGFFQDKPLPQTIDDNWRTWWDSREMYAKQELKDIPVYGTQNNWQLLDGLINDKTFGCAEDYDPISQNWTFVSVFFSENYIEILPMLAFLKSLATFQDYDGDGVAMVFDYFWGDSSVMAYLEFSNQQADLKDYTATTQIEPTILQEANQTLKNITDSFNTRE